MTAQQPLYAGIWHTVILGQTLRVRGNGRNWIKPAINDQA